MNGNKDLGIGIARGAGSFAKKTVFGVSDSLAKISGSIGKGESPSFFIQYALYGLAKHLAQGSRRPRSTSSTRASAACDSSATSPSMPCTVSQQAPLRS